ncbi:MAG: hypothetical protein JNL98_23585, partial [Bryobacterales bacterium]|nr:hypothetical protein [Bryobacterales bacterium]
MLGFSTFIRLALVVVVGSIVTALAQAQSPNRAERKAGTAADTRQDVKVEDLRNLQPEDYRVYTEHPRLLINARRLRLLRRERERKTLRWEQFDTLITGNAEMPEKGFAWALHYLTAEDAATGKQAIQWALGPAADLRQIAIVYDWCHPLLSETQARTLESKLADLLRRERRDTVAAVRDKAFAAIALADHVKDLPEATLQQIYRQWWLEKMVTALLKDRSALTLTDGYPLIELMHVIQDNLKFDMRDNARP